ncbi:hypothetical protein QYM36_000870 [Artemia franciscana]|uniref:Uncharacterized protein n=1 Tax=Artemia franciscana TaxID=6661 RepID=A0AA88LBC5_ARTSF|nr:hypothetical protein QYM36_000870 [Artemia franciscana]
MKYWEFALQKGSFLRTKIRTVAAALVAGKGFVDSVAVRTELNVHIVADTALVDYIAVGIALVDYIAVCTALDIAADSALTVDMGFVDHVAVGTALNVRIAALAAGSSLIYTVAALAVDIPALGFEGIAALVDTAVAGSAHLKQYCFQFSLLPRAAERKKNSGCAASATGANPVLL